MPVLTLKSELQCLWLRLYFVGWTPTLAICLVTDPRRISSSRKTNWMSSEKRENHLKITSQKGKDIDHEYPFDSATCRCSIVALQPQYKG